MNNRSSQTLASRLAVAMLLTLVMAASTVVGSSLTGTVIDRSDGNPLLGATITVRPLNPTGEIYGTTSGVDGNFEVQNIPAGEYGVTISFVGYTPEMFTLLFGADSDAVERDANLMPRAIDLNTISVTASRRPEKVNDAPAAVSVISSETIAEHATLTVTDHLKGVPSIDIAKTGLNQSNVVTRGFNNIFSGALLVLTDNRIARVPSLRFNAYNFISTVNEDIDRIEVVSGPGSALYGPNSAAGVMHIVTKSPFGSEGTTVSIGGGERDLMLGSFRHAGNVNNRFGYKFSGQYYQGNDWEHHEASEPDSVFKFRPTSDGADTVVALADNSRNFDTEKLSGEARFDFLINENTSLILNGGYNQSTGIELTGLGAGQAIDWAYKYFQARMKYKDLFVQAYVNSSDAGDTYLLNTGQLIVDLSKVTVAQIQHSYQPNDRFFFTYGADAIQTRPNTDGTINGRNEDNDDINEYGVYVQAEAQLNEQFKFVGAARVDDHNQLEDLIFSPRAALVFKPSEQHSFRMTYNRAFSTPDNNNLYLDLLQSKNPFGTGIDIRVQGVPESGFSWRFDDTGNPMFRSPFSVHPLINGEAADYYDYGDTRFTNFAWGAGRGLVLDTLNAHLSTAVAGGLLSQGAADAMLGIVGGMAPATIPGMGNKMRALSLDTGKPEDVDNSFLKDIARLEPSITQTFELGYKGTLGNRIRFSVDAYRTKKDNFVGPLSVETPNIFLDDADLVAYLGPQFTIAYGGLSTLQKQAVDNLDSLAFGGNGNGTPIDELVSMFATGGTKIAIGTVTPDEALNPNDVLITYRNFGDITYYGADLSFNFHLNRSWDFGGSYSYVSKNFFPKNAEQVHDIRLNAPRNKFSLFAKYNRPTRKLMTEARVRYVDAFDMDSPFLGSRVKSYILLDLNLGINVVANTRFTLSVENVADHMHIEFVGAPAIGRLAIARLTQTF